MELMTLLYTILGALSVSFAFIAVAIIAGKDILFAFFRRFNPKGSEVFIINLNRQISRYYKKSKDGVFIIKGSMYITNPDKILGLSDEMKKEIDFKKNRGLKKIKEKIRVIDNKLVIVLKQINGLKDIADNAKTLDSLKLQYAELENLKATLENKLLQREQGYYFDRRGAYFYIENDPVPKDFYEQFSEMDSIQLENVIIRAQSKDPKDLLKIENHLLWIKRFIIFALIASAVAGFFALKNNSAIVQLAESSGVTLTI